MPPVARSTHHAVRSFFKTTSFVLLAFTIATGLTLLPNLEANAADGELALTMNGKLSSDQSKISYTFTVQNKGDVAVSNIEVSARRLSDVKCDDTTLEPGARTHCKTSEPYAVTASDMAKRSVSHTAVASGDVDGTTVKSRAETERTTLSPPKPETPRAKPAQENKPDAKPAKPADDQAKPSDDQAKPADDQAKPAEDPAPQANPADPQSQPTAKQADPQAKPAAKHAKPASKAKPAAKHAKPAAQHAKPVAKHSTPAAKHAKPVAKDAAPAAQPLAAPAPVGAPSPDPTDPTTDPTSPATDPTEPTTGPTDPATDPTDPTDPTTEPTTDPTTEPTDPATEPTDPTTEPTEPIQPLDGPLGLPGGPSPRGLEGPALSVTTSVVPDSVIDGKAYPNTTVKYKIVVTNTGDVSFTDVAVADSLTAPSGTHDLTVTCDGYTSTTDMALAAGKSATCWASYKVAGGIGDVGNLANTATATALAGDVTASSDVVNVPVLGATALPTLTKTANVPWVAESSATHGTVIYTITVTNTTDATVSDILIDDFKFTGKNPRVFECGFTNGSLSLDPGESASCTLTYQPVHNDCGQQSGATTDKSKVYGWIENQAKIKASTDVLSNIVDIPVYCIYLEPEISLTKTASAYESDGTTPKADNAATVAGDIIKYDFTVTNTSMWTGEEGVTLSDVTVTDPGPHPGGTPLAITCDTNTPLGHNESMVCHASYTVTQDDIDSGADLVNTATATGTDAVTGATVSDDDTATIHIKRTPAKLNMAKTVELNGEPVTTATKAKVNDILTYKLVATNEGGTTAHNVYVDDSTFTGKGDLTGWDTCQASDGTTNGTGPYTLKPNETVTCELTYKVTQDDIDLVSSIHNEACATADDVDKDCAHVDVPVEKIMKLTLEKTVSPAEVTTAPTTVTYTFHVTNAGTTTITDLTIIEDAAKWTGSGSIGAITCDATTLKPHGTTGDSTNCHATYVVTQTDIDNGADIYNVATAQGKTGDDSTTSDPDDATVKVTQAPNLSVAKQVYLNGSTDPDESTVVVPGDKLTYVVTVENNGNTTLTHVSIADTFSANAGEPPTGWAQTCQVVDATKASKDPAPATTFTLKPGGKVTCTFVYTVTTQDYNNAYKADLTAITNTACATATPPKGDDVTKCDDTKSPIDVKGPSLSITKQIVDIDGKQVPALTKYGAGDTVYFQLIVTNNGDVTLTNVKVTDLTDPTLPEHFTGKGAAPTASLMCDYLSSNTVHKSGQAINGALAFVLDPSEQATCTASYVLTQDDVDAYAGGEFVNWVLGEAKGPKDEDVNAKDDVPIPVVDAAPHLTVTKEVTQVLDPDGAPVTITPLKVRVGDTINYRITVTNDGNVLQNDVTLADTGFTGTGTKPTVDLATCKAVNGGVETPLAYVPPATPTSLPTFTLHKDEMVYCDVSYTVVETDLALDEIVNSATAKDTTPEEPPVVPVGHPALTATKSVTAVNDVAVTGKAPAVTVGDLIWYAVKVTNSGDVTLTGITVEDTVLPASGTNTAELDKCTYANATEVANGEITLAPDATATCMFTYRVLLDDMALTLIKDQAKATDDRDITDETEVVEVPVGIRELTVTKHVVDAEGNVISDPAPVGVGDVIRYVIKVETTGDVTVHNVTVEDKGFTGTGVAPVVIPAECALHNGLPGTATGTFTLPPGAWVVCPLSYTVVEGDMTLVEIVNSATAKSDDKPPIVPPDDPKVPIAKPAISVTKTAMMGDLPIDPATALLQPGMPVNYTVTTTNTGNVTLTKVGVDDVGFSGSGPFVPADATCSIDDPATPGIPKPVLDKGNVTLVPGAKLICLLPTYTVTQDDALAGEIYNGVHAYGTPDAGTDPKPVTDDDNITIPTAPVVLPTNPGEGVKVATGGLATGSAMSVLPLLFMAGGALAFALAWRRRRPTSGREGVH